METVVVSGREFSANILARIRHEVVQRPDMSRSQLAREVCEWIDWKGHDGSPKEVSCRIALGKLERLGALTLPEAQGQIPRASPMPAPEPPEPVSLSLDELGELHAVVVTSSQRDLNADWKGLMSHHYLGSGPLIGRQLRYLIGSDKGWVAGFAFSSPAWALAARDEWIGWSLEARQANLGLVVLNSRFCIPPWLRVPDLASKTLALCAQQLPEDWQQAYGYRPVLLETYVEQERFHGTCYRAANWQHVGQTSGRRRDDRTRQHSVPFKDIYLLPLVSGCKAVLKREPSRNRPRPPRLDTPRDWAEEEFGGATLGDGRRSRRLVDLARSFYSRPQASLPQACNGTAQLKGAYRLLANKNVSLKEILQPHYESTTRRIWGHEVVLAVQDTTTFNYTTHTALEGIGPMGSSENKAIGLLMHDTMAFTVKGMPLGLIDVKVWARDPKDFGTKHERAMLPIEEKESSKWLRSYEATTEVQARCPDTTLVSVGDREADVYELFELAVRQEGTPKLLVRAEHNRRVNEEQPHLWEHLRQQPVCARPILRVDRTKKHKEREASLEVRYAAVELKPPKRPRPGKKLRPVNLWAVLVTEVDPPEGVDALEWMLLTTMEVATAEQAFEKVEWYSKRWGIETFHKVVKSGCRIEERQLRTVARLENCLAIDLVIAWRIQHLTMLGRETPELPCTVFFDDNQWKSLYAFIARDPLAVPKDTPTINEVMRKAATLGGFLGRKHDGEPGVKVLWIGLQRLEDIAAAWVAFGHGTPMPPPDSG